MKKMINSVIKFLATGFYSGLSPKAPGTAGSAAALLIYCLLGIYFREKTGTVILIIFAAGVLPAVIISDFAEKLFLEKDPQKVVIDEFFGLWLCFILLPFSFKGAAAGFLLFRLFDICKPFPINSLQKIRGGLGIMVDDLMAGLIVRLIFAAVIYFNEYLPVNIF